MSTSTIIFGIVLVVFAVFLVVAVLMQQGKAHNLSGAIAGGAETFFGKSKGQTINKKLNTLTTIVSIIFVLIVLGFYATQAPAQYDSIGDYFKGKTSESKTEEVVEDAEEAADAVGEIAVDAADTVADAVESAAE